MKIWPGQPYPLGSTYDGFGTNFSVAHPIAILDTGIDGSHPDITPNFDPALSRNFTTDIPLDEPAKPVNLSSIDFDLGAGTTTSEEKEPSDFASGGTLKLDKPEVDETVSSLDFDLNTGTLEKKLGEASGIDFDLNLDLGDKAGEAEKSVPPLDLSSISLDLGSLGEPGAPSSNDPKWQEVATKLDLAKAYEEMGDKDGARELLSEVMKDGDAAQKGQAQQLLTKLG
jgi:pilus assembly protein FimV